MTTKLNLRAFWPNKTHPREIIVVWTCCDACHLEHRTPRAARLHWNWIRLRERSAQLVRALKGAA